VNYLAHIYLSGDHPEAMIGGLLGDFVKGPLRGQLPRTIEEGIALHRKIDVFTDSLPEVKKAVARIEPPYRRFGGILIDICYDHFLAANWSEFHPQHLENYCQHFYQILSEYEHHLPPAAKQFNAIAPKVRWLESYAQMENIEYILERVGQRFRTTVPLNEAFPQLVRDYPLLSREFSQVFPKIIAFAEDHRSR
jgi:acyl carrier protein phosphodiesterase